MKKPALFYASVERWSQPFALRSEAAASRPVEKSRDMMTHPLRHLYASMMISVKSFVHAFRDI
ncbi:hypothetical protein [Streptomyces sp. NPDC006638]|uniref:hypothetical protein n=1 Tax=Streptomyces sp. NPDC006638 TaxID=3157183 RepID=UPI0033BF2818